MRGLRPARGDPVEGPDSERDGGVAGAERGEPIDLIVADPPWRWDARQSPLRLPAHEASGVLTAGSPAVGMAH